MTEGDVGPYAARLDPGRFDNASETTMSAFWLSDQQQAIRDSVARVCADFDAEYWRRTDDTGDFPEAFVAAMAAGGWLGAGHAHGARRGGPGPH